MENPEQNFSRDSEQQMLQEILDNTRKTKNYLKWQLVITIAMVVIPFVMILIILPMILNSVGSIDVSGLQ